MRSAGQRSGDGDRPKMALVAVAPACVVLVTLSVDSKCGS